MHPFSTSSGTLEYHDQRVRGFTAIELMVVVSILAILAALAAPSFKPLIERWRVRSATEGLQSAIYFARSEAIKRGGKVVLQKLGSINGCTAPTTQEWHCGWYVCEDTNGNGACTSSEPVLQRFDAPAKMEVMRTSNGASIAFDRWGMPGQWLGFTLKPENSGANDPATLGVCMSSGGRVRVIPSEQTPCTDG